MTKIKFVKKVREFAKIKITKNAGYFKLRDEKIVWVILIHDFFY